MPLGTDAAAYLRPCTAQNYTSIGASKFTVIADGPNVHVKRLRNVSISQVKQVEFDHGSSSRDVFLNELRLLQDEQIGSVLNIIAADCEKTAYTLITDINKIARLKDFDFVSEFVPDTTEAVIASLQNREVR